ncbi:MAG: succinate-semialdehyde dehydrogenase (NADP(+)), partial [Rhodospirillales bacterium]|nr:succinate-semialdehyde dehydrogenase (NADP(+)) [Rhodospirillales bacterium]
MQLNDSRLFRQQCYVAGKWIDADDGKTFAVTNPATGETLANAPRLGRAETRRAIEAADA